MHRIWGDPIVKSHPQRTGKELVLSLWHWSTSSKLFLQSPAPSRNPLTSFSERQVLILSTLLLKCVWKCFDAGGWCPAGISMIPNATLASNFSDMIGRPSAWSIAPFPSPVPGAPNSTIYIANAGQFESACCPRYNCWHSQFHDTPRSGPTFQFLVNNSIFISRFI